MCEYNNYTQFIEEEVTSGEVKIKLNYGKIPIVDETLDMCDLITEIGKSCPVKAGPFEVVLKQNLPDYVPSVSTETPTLRYL